MFFFWRRVPLSYFFALFYFDMVNMQTEWEKYKTNDSTLQKKLITQNPLQAGMSMYFLFV